MMDIFAGNPEQGAYNLRAMTASLEDVPYVPNQVGQLGLFQGGGIANTRLSIERRGTHLALIQSSARGSPSTQYVPVKRDMVPLETVHFSAHDTIYPDEVQGVRAFGTENETATIAARINESQTNLMRDVEFTWENMRLGALQGIVKDADGSTLYNLFDIFGVTVQGTVDLDLGATTPITGGHFRKFIIQELVRPMFEVLDGLPWSGNIHVLCAGDVIDALWLLEEVRATYLATADAPTLRMGTAYGRIEYPTGVVWEEYRGNVNGGPAFAAGKGIAFPVGVANLFLSRFAPADYFETVNTMGLPVYSRLLPDPEADRYRRVELQSNPIFICTRPRCLFPIDAGL